ncbi:MAG: flavodoxin family protein [Syntrophomonadaceae bacterium]|jgi:multimeric flavodoxin WrbA|nr:flavodoxin family protein [Syntrophomonadaceae bacterium]
MQKVKVLGISGSPRHANTETLVDEALKAARELGPVDTELISLAGLTINPCDGCNKCYGYSKGASWDRLCYKHDDDVTMIYKKIREADGIIVGSPVYTGDITAKLKALMERGACFCHYSASPVAGSIRNKVIGGIVVAFERRGGQEGSLQSIWRWATGIMFSYVVGAVPFPDDPPPQASALGGLADTCDSWAGLGKYGAMPQTTRTQPPNSGVFNLRSVRNLGKNVALGALLINRGTLALQSEGISVPPLPLTSFPEKILQPDSYLKQLREGKLQAPSYQVSQDLL